MHLDVGVALVILQADVVARAVLLDQVHLQDEGFQFRSDHDPFDIGDVAHKLAGLVILVGAGVEVGAHPVAQADGLANVNDIAGAVFHDVTARFGWQRIEDALDVLGDIAHGEDSTTGGKTTTKDTKRLEVVDEYR